MKNLIRFLSFALALSILLALNMTTFAADDTGFSDVPADAGYAEAVRWAADHGYVNGYGDGRFGTNDNVTRAQLAAILYRAAGTPASSGVSRFSDVSATAYYIDAASWAEDNGLINGYPDGRFGVGDPVTRQQVATILWRWAGSPNATAEDYADESGIAEYARTAVDWSRGDNIMDTRSNNRFAPADSATRGEIVSALYNYMGRSSAPSAPDESDGGKALVVYFSPANSDSVDAVSSAAPRVGDVSSVEFIAQIIGNQVTADVAKIVPANPYPVIYEETVDRAKAERDEKVHPEFALDVDPEEYDVIFVGYPIWWYEMPMVMQTFFDTYDFSGKTIIPFNNHAGSIIFMRLQYRNE